MTLEDAIKHAKEVAKENDDSANEFYRVSKLKLETHPDRKRAEYGYVECKECADEHRQLASWLKELKRLRTEVYFLKAERENTPVDLLGDVPCKTCKWRVTTTEKCEECIDGVSDNYEVQEPCEDCVSRQAAIDAALSAFSRGLLASPDIRKLPSVQPEIIRCKDCKWCENADGSMCKNPASWVVATDRDFGCVLAERRTDDQSK